MRKNCHIGVVYEDSSNPDTVVEIRSIPSVSGFSGKYNNNSDKKRIRQHFLLYRWFSALSIPPVAHDLGCGGGGGAGRFFVAAPAGFTGWSGNRFFFLTKELFEIKQLQFDPPRPTDIVFKHTKFRGHLTEINGHDRRE